MNNTIIKAGLQLAKKKFGDEIYVRAYRSSEQCFTIMEQIATLQIGLSRAGSRPWEVLGNFNEDGTFVPDYLWCPDPTIMSWVAYDFPPAQFRKEVLDLSSIGGPVEINNSVLKWISNGPSRLWEQYPTQPRYICWEVRFVRNMSKALGLQHNPNALASEYNVWEFNMRDQWDLFNWLALCLRAIDSAQVVQTGALQNIFTVTHTRAFTLSYVDNPAGGLGYDEGMQLVTGEPATYDAVVQVEGWPAYPNVGDGVFR